MSAHDAMTQGGGSGGPELEQPAARPILAKGYDFADREAPRVGGTVVPWHLAIEGPRVEELDDHTHILWLPVLVLAPCPKPGPPDGTSLEEISSPGELTCPSCGYEAVVDRPESDTWVCDACGAEGHGSP